MKWIPEWLAFGIVRLGSRYPTKEEKDHYHRENSTGNCNHKWSKPINVEYQHCLHESCQAHRVFIPETKEEK